MFSLRKPILVFAITLAGLGSAAAQTFDISSGGAPTITGNVGGSVTGSSSTTSNLVVTVNFGELSPSNTNNVVKVTVPVAIRSDDPYRVTATVTGGTNPNPQALQRGDVGFGARNMRASGWLSRTCSSPHIFYNPFTLDPATNRSILPNGRVGYPGDLGDMSGATTILTGPILSWLAGWRLTTNAYIFDTIFAVSPQFFAAGNTSMTVTFTISAGPNVPC